MALEIRSSVDADTARIALTGELDGSTAPALRETVARVLSGKPARLVLQVEQLSFMASAGLRILIFAKQKQPGLNVCLVKPQLEIVETLHKTGFYDGVYVTEAEPGLHAVNNTGRMRVLGDGEPFSSSRPACGFPVMTGRIH